MASRPCNPIPLANTPFSRLWPGDVIGDPNDAFQRWTILAQYPDEQKVDYRHDPSGHLFTRTWATMEHNFQNGFIFEVGGYDLIPEVPRY